jgi:hypothetical protein
MMGRVKPGAYEDAIEQAEGQVEVRVSQCTVQHHDQIKSQPHLRGNTQQHDRHQRNGAINQIFDDVDPVGGQQIKRRRLVVDAVNGPEHRDGMHPPVFPVPAEIHRNEKNHQADGVREAVEQIPVQKQRQMAEVRIQPRDQRLL